MAKADLVNAGLLRARSNRAALLNRYGTEITLASILLLLFVALTIATPVFMTAQNLSNLVKQSAINGIIALGMTIAIITGGAWTCPAVNECPDYCRPAEPFFKLRKCQLPFFPIAILGLGHSCGYFDDRAKLQALVGGKTQATMFELTKYVNQHLL